MRNLMLYAVGAAALVGAAASVQAANIDNFNDGAFYLQLFPGDLSEDDTQAGAPANIIGGERYTLLEYAPGGDGGIVEAALLDGGTMAFFNNGAFAAGILTLTYGMNAPLNADFSSDSFFALDFSFVDGIGEFEITVVSGAGSGTSTATAVVAAGEHQVSFADAGFAGVDFSDVDSITVQITANSLAADFALDGIFTGLIPAPGALALLGLAGLAGTRRRRA